MKNLNAFWATRGDWFSSVGREQQIKDYISLANQLIWQRHASFLVVAMLGAFYYDPVSTFGFYLVVALIEALDLILGRRSKAWDGQDSVVGQKILKRIAYNTVASATAISVFIVSIAIQQTSGGHFAPLFFLFSASLFAAMYNSQMIGILILRLSIYGIAFLCIALIDVVRYLPPLSSHIWLEFFTTILVLYFIFDISVNFYIRNQERLDQLKTIKEENERTKAAMVVKSQFLSTVSHELRTPLTSILGPLDLINTGALGEVPENFKPVIGIAAKNGQRLAALIDDLLDLQKIESGDMAFDFKPIGANDLVNEAVESTAGYADKLGIHVSTVPSDEDFRIMGDRRHLIQVMNNLLSNALKFSNEGGAVKVCVEPVGARIRISVHDEGVGIPGDAKDRVFGKFSQIDSSDVRKVGGTGLGLNITKQIVERHNASIDYVSELGVGSTFYLEFDRLTEIDGTSADLEPVADVARGGGIPVIWGQNSKDGRGNQCRAT